MIAVAVLLLLLLTGAPLAWRLAGTSAEAVVLAPLVSAGLLAVAATAHLAVGGRFVIWGAAALVGGAVLPLVHRTRVPRRRSAADLLLLAGPLAVLAWTLSTLQRYHVGWDGRSIWFFHGRMLVAGQEEYLRIADNFGYLHADYPPLAPAVLAFAWEVTSSIDYRTGQVLLAALTACATVLAGLSLARGLRWRTTGVVAATAAVAVSYGVWDAAATNGYVDPLVAALVLAGAGFGILAERTPRHDALALTALVLAAMTKNEGVPYAVAVLSIMLAVALVARWRGRSEQTPLSSYAVALVAMALWPLTVRGHGLSRSPIGPAEGADPAERAVAVLDALLPTVDLVLWAGAGLVVACLVVADRRALRSLLYAVAVLACTGVLVSAYALGPHEIEWWLRTSLSRTSMVLRTGGLLLAVFTAAAAAEFALRRTAAPGSAEAPPPADGDDPAPLSTSTPDASGSDATAPDDRQVERPDVAATGAGRPGAGPTR